MRFGIGQSTPRLEDRRFLTGRGRFVAGIALPGDFAALFVRSPVAHADILAIDTRRARAVPGVAGVWTGADVAAAGLGDIPCPVPLNDRSGNPMPSHGRPLLAAERVRYVGDTVAMIVADRPSAAIDAADRLLIDYDPMPHVVTIDDALCAGAPALWDDAPGNIAFFWERGDRDAVERALADAPHRIELRLVNNRVVPCAMEPRAVLGAFDPATGQYTLHTGCQGAHAVRDQLCLHTLGVPKDKLRVIVPDVGGGFGTKAFHYPEEALVLWAAAQLGRPVAWVGDRREAFLCDTHGRDQINRVTAAVAADGRVLALRVHTFGNMGAYLNAFGPAIPSRMTGCMLSGAYAIPHIHATCEGVYTNTTPVDAYRGAGRPEATYVIERLMDRIARTLGLAPDEVRRRNFVRPAAMPYRSAMGPVYDSGDYAATLALAQQAAGWAGFETRRAAAAGHGRLRGIGLSTYVEICGFDAEEATVRVQGDGTAEVLIGTQSTGQGHETAYAQIAGERLGINPTDIAVVQGDTARIPFGRGTGGSRSMPVGGHAVGNACASLIDAARSAAASLLQADEAAVSFKDGRFHAALGGSVTLAEVADAAGGAGLTATERYSLPASTFPSGCHIAEVEIDRETGEVAVAGYWVADDFGTVINPLLLEGQVHGGIVQGIGQALLEHAVYDRQSGQLLTASFADYAVPRAADVPSFDVHFLSTPCTTNPLGIKGAGEAGTIAACPAVINAVIDALSPFGIDHIDMPATAETIWRALCAASSQQTGETPA